MGNTEDHLIGQHAPLVRRLALRLVSRLPSNVELDDLMQAGMMGLLDAIRRYQETPTAQFETYAVTRIRGAMIDELRSQDWLPRSVRSKSRTIETAIQRLNHRLLRPATEIEISQELDMPLADYQALLEDAHGVQVVHYEDLARFQDDGGNPLDTLQETAEDSAGHRASPLNQLISGGLREQLIEAIKSLPEREQLLLSLHFEQDLNQKEVAAVMGVTEGRVSQLRSQAIVRIRASLARADWDESPGETELLNLL